MDPFYQTELSLILAEGGSMLVCSPSMALEAFSGCLITYTLARQQVQLMIMMYYSCIALEYIVN